MRLIIHGGLHKTGSTSFQLAMRHFSRLCLTHGLFYPLTPTGPGHHVWAQLAQDGQLEFVDPLIDEARAAVGADGAVLLSSEDFESLLMQPPAARALEDRFRTAGCTDITWTFVVRDRFEYLLSLYAEMSKHSVLFEIGALARTAMRFGHVQCSNVTTNWAFVFDYETVFPAFAAGVTGSVSVDNMAAETLFPGSRILLTARMPESAVREMAEEFNTAVPASLRNLRSSPEVVERNYARTFLSVAETADGSSADLLREVTRVRVEAFARTAAELRPLVTARFPREYGPIVEGGGELAMRV